MKKLLALLLVLVCCSNLAHAGWWQNRKEAKETDFTKRNEAYLRDVKKREAKRRYNKAIEDRLPSGKMTVEEYEMLSKHKNPDSSDELKPIKEPIMPIPSEMKYAPQPVYKIVRYNDPPGSVELNLGVKFHHHKQQNCQGVVSPDYSKMVYTAVYYSPDSASTSAELFVIPLDKNETELDRILKAHTSNRMPHPLMATSKTIDNFATFRTLTPVDFSSDSSKVLVKEKIGNSYDGIWQTNVWIYDFDKEEAIELAEIRDAIVHHWTTYRGLPLIDKRWDIVPLGFSLEEPGRIICTAYAYTGKKPIFLGVWSIDFERSQSRLVSLDNVEIPISINGFKIVKAGVKPYNQVASEEEILKEQDKENKKAQKKAVEQYNEECKKRYEAELKVIDDEYKANIKEYNKLKKYNGSTTYADAVDKYREAKIKELEKTLQKEEKQIEKLNRDIEKLNVDLEKYSPDAAQN